MGDDISIDLEARDKMYEELVDEFGEEIVDNEIAVAARQALSRIYDNREQLRQQIEAQE